MKSHWCVLALTVGWMMAAAGCGPEEKYCVNVHGVCQPPQTSNGSDAASPGNGIGDGGPIIIGGGDN